MGDAVIRLNIRYLPEKIVREITDETTKQGITPTSPFGLKRWFGMPHTMTNIPKYLVGFRGWSHTVNIPQAGGGSVKQVTATDIIQNGYGSEIIEDRNRLEW